MAPENPFTCDGIWLRAALHTHTTESDGRWSPAQIAAEYRAAGYDVLVITDHNRVTDAAGLSGEGLLVLPGQEMHPTGNRGICYHLLAVGLPETVRAEKLTPQETVDAARAQGAVVFKAHPTWCGLTAADVNDLEKVAGLEVWNATCLRHAKPSSEALWDELLAAGRLLPAIATDDCHRPAEHFRGDFNMAWTMIRAAEGSPGAILEALAAGRFYATLGPVIEDFRLVGDPESPSGLRATARFSPARSVSFVSDASAGRCYEFEGEVSEFEHPVSGSATYVRLAVEDARARRAWSGPLAVPQPGSGGCG